MPELATGDIEGAFKELRERADTGKASVKFAADPNFYTVLVFDTSEQRDVFLAFLDFVGRESGIEIVGARYLDGRAVAQALGVELPEGPPRLTSPFKVAPKLADLAMTMEDHLNLPLPGEFPALQFETEDNKGVEQPDEWDPLGDIDSLDLPSFGIDDPE